MKQATLRNKEKFGWENSKLENKRLKSGAIPLSYSNKQFFYVARKANDMSTTYYG